MPADSIIGCCFYFKLQPVLWYLPGEVATILANIYDRQKLTEHIFQIAFVYLLGMSIRSITISIFPLSGSCSVTQVKRRQQWQMSWNPGMWRLPNKTLFLPKTVEAATETREMRQEHLYNTWYLCTHSPQPTPAKTFPQRCCVLEWILPAVSWTCTFYLQVFSQKPASQDNSRRGHHQAPVYWGQRAVFL